MALADNAAPIITAVGGIVATIAALVVALKQPKTDKGNSDRAAVAVTNFERTSVRVDTLWDTIKDLINEVGILKEDKAVQQEAINRLTKELEEERGSHAKTRKELEELKELHKQTLLQIAEKDKLIQELMKGQVNQNGI